MKRLLGYVVKLPDGTRSALTKRPVPFRQASCTASADDHARGHVLTPVFAVRKSVVVPTQITTEEQVRAFNALDPKPAPVVAGERYACMEGCFMWLGDEEEENPRDSGTRAEAEARAVGIPGAKVVRILPDGAHEAAVAKAREDVLSVVRRVLTADGAYEKPLGTLRDEIVGRVNGGES